jgi:hypothetical protein
MCHYFAQKSMDAHPTFWSSLSFWNNLNAGACLAPGLSTTYLSSYHQGMCADASIFLPLVLSY